MAPPPAAALLLFLFLLREAASETDPVDFAVLAELLRNVGGLSALPSWTGDDPCGSNWDYIQCDGAAVTGIQLKNTKLQGSFPPSLNRMINLQNIGLQGNNFTGPLPSLRGLSRLQTAYLDYQSFTSIPADFFHGLPSLTLLSLDYSPLNASDGGWMLPLEVGGLTALVTLSLTAVHLTGEIPSFLANLPKLQNLRLAYNHLYGAIPASFASAQKLVSLQLNNQVGLGFNGTIAPVGGIQTLSQLWLQVNAFSGTIPDGLGSLPTLKDCRLNDNQLVGPIPASFSTSTSLQVFSVRHNRLNGSPPAIPSLSADNYTIDGNGFCTDMIGGACSLEVEALLAFLGGFGYPADLAATWSGDDPCSWVGISCDADTGKVVTINLPNHELSGTISPAIANLTSLQNLILNDNSIYGNIPRSLSSIASLRRLWLQNNNISAPMPPLSPKVSVNLTGNPSFDGNAPAPSSLPAAAHAPSPQPASGPSPPSAAITGGISTTDKSSPSTSTQQIANGGGDPRQSHLSESTGKTSPLVLLVAGVIGAVCFAFMAGMLAVILMKKRKKYTQVGSPLNAMDMTQSDDSGGGAATSQKQGNNNSSSSRSNVEVSEALTERLVGVRPETVESGNLLISIQVLRNVTENFSERNVVGKGGFGVVYKGELDDGTKIAVKRMEATAAAILSGKGMKEFLSEIGVLTKVRHRNLVSLLGYCMDGGERMLVYEYMGMGPLSRHLFEYQKLALPPLSWKRRLCVALDVARGMEYLHSLARPASFIHRDLKSSNILLSDDYRAKVSDFGLVKLVNEDKSSVETRLAGTFGYLAPEYAVTGRVTTKSDVFSFGVVLMELITGRRAIDEAQPEDSVHLVAWFRRMNGKLDKITEAMDPALEGAEEESTVRSVRVVAELAGHCTAREAWQRPDMSHAVNVLLPLVEQWKPTDVGGGEGGEEDGIDLDMTLPQALKKWQAFNTYSGVSESSSSALFSRQSSDGDGDSTNGSMPCRPAGFAHSFTSDDGR